MNIEIIKENKKQTQQHSQTSQTQKSKQSQLTKEEINNYLKYYTKVKDINKVPLNTHIYDILQRIKIKRK